MYRGTKACKEQKNEIARFRNFIIRSFHSEHLKYETRAPQAGRKYSGVTECEIETRQHNAVVSLPDSDSSSCFGTSHMISLYLLPQAFPIKRNIYLQEFFFLRPAFTKLRVSLCTWYKIHWVYTSGCKINVKTFLLFLSLNFTLMCTWCNMSQATYAAFQKIVKLVTWMKNLYTEWVQSQPLRRYWWKLSKCKENRWFSKTSVKADF